MNRDVETNLFQEQVNGLQEAHFLVLYWVAVAEDRGLSYNITNCFDDLKARAVTRTKQTATSIIETLQYLRFIDVRDEGNRKNMYITPHGARALESLVREHNFSPQKSFYLEA